MPDSLNHELLQDIAARTLEEDCGQAGDVTTCAVIPSDAEAEAVFYARNECVCAGLPLVQAIYEALDESLEVSALVADGTSCRHGQKLASVKGNARSILTGERSSLNFLQRLSGIATLTRRFVDAVGVLGPRILDTRKTTPLLRSIEKYAVRCGGGVNHRMGLYDRIMVKDNHRLIGGFEEVKGIGEAVARCRKAYPELEVEVEADTLEQAEAAINAGADYVLLDNMPPHVMKQAVDICAGRALLEASGNVTLETVKEIARSGVDFISVGALTHSAPAVDINLEVTTT